MASSTATKMLFLCLVVFCAVPMIQSKRIPLHQKSMGRRVLFQKLGFDDSMEELSRKNDLRSPFREAPGGPDPHHHFSIPVSTKGPEDASMEELSRKNDVGSSFREAPGGPDPHHHFSIPPINQWP